MFTPVSFHIGGAEVLLRISPGEFTTAGGEVFADTGPWLADPIAGVARGALAVALDDVTGYAIAAGVPADRWPVSLGIRVDFLADPSTCPGRLSVTGEVVGRDSRGGTTRGAVTDDDGEVLAIAVQRSHLIQSTGLSAAVAAGSLVDADAPIRSQLGLVDAEDAPAGAVALAMPATPLAANGMGNVHGGMLIAVSELAAMSAIDARCEYRTTSIDIAYVRPCDAAAPTTFTAEPQHVGRSLAVVRVVAANPSGKPSSIATVILQRR
ncbi:PaaI family thioesterase [Gordonia soli]|uniref:Acyl-CoA thioesterase-like N-terminal HotDog domain-containing protein n=1 Tax=Gordonia soli NBRC 108243 TaxID=1223545 RepID=M0QIW5_9ACTN|nr:PaaI family thioesterase [Gordonia soli]GAC67352.1 hypothetical protein GS4_07_01010 [Gordonia soli NBRC 108243]